MVNIKVLNCQSTLLRLSIAMWHMIIFCIFLTFILLSMSFNLYCTLYQLDFPIIVLIVIVSLQTKMMMMMMCISIITRDVRKTEILFGFDS